MKNRIKTFIAGKLFSNFILAIIVLNAITIGLATSEEINSKIGQYLEIIEEVFLVIYIIEIVLKLYAYRLSFFGNNWNLFDSFIVMTSLVSENEIMSVFRILRVIRVLRLVSIVPKMRLISQTLLKSIVPMSSVGVLLLILFYIYAVITTHLYGKDFPQWFGDLGESFYSLFQIMTFESWSMGIVRPVMEIYPQAWLVFVSFLLFASYIVLNIAIGVIVDCIGDIKNQEQQLEEHSSLEQKLRQFEAQLAEITDLLRRNDK